MEHLLGVELRHLAALSAINEERSFRGAADKLGYVQSAVSQQISRLERLVGVRLVERSRGHAYVALTEAGELLLEHAEAVLSHLDAARADLEALADGSGGTLRAGVFQSVATRVLPEVLVLLRNRRPDIRVVTVEASSDSDLFARVERGELDVAFAEMPLDDGPFTACELFRDPCVLILPVDSELAQRGEPVSLEQVAEIPLVAHPNWRLTQLLEAEFAARGLRPHQEFHAQTNSAVQALVSNGLAGAILPRLAVDTEDPTIAVLPVEDMLPERTIALYWHRDRQYGPTLDAFRDAAIDACADRFGSDMATLEGRRRVRERAEIVRPLRAPMEWATPA